MQKQAHQQAQVTSTILLKEPSAIFIVPHSALLNLILDCFLTTITTNGGTEAQQSASAPLLLGGTLWPSVTGAGQRWRGINCLRTSGKTTVSRCWSNAKNKAQQGVRRRGKARSYYAESSAGGYDGVCCGVRPLIVSPKIRELLPFPMSVGHSWPIPILILFITRFVITCPRLV